MHGSINKFGTNDCIKFNMNIQVNAFYYANLKLVLD